MDRQTEYNWYSVRPSMHNAPLYVRGHKKIRQKLNTFIYDQNSGICAKREEELCWKGRVNMYDFVSSANFVTVTGKISPVGDWRSTSLEWPWRWPWFRPYGIQSCITHRPLPTYQISLRSEEKIFWKSPLRFWWSSESRDTKTRTNIRNPARSNLDIVL